MEKQDQYVSLSYVMKSLGLSRGSVISLQDELEPLVLPSGHRRFRLDKIEEFIQKYSTKKENEKENPTDQ